MADLTFRDEARRLNSPPLQGRGRGWGLSAGRIDVLQDRAAEMRRNPTEPEKRLWRALSNGQLGGYKFRRQAVIGDYIADFACPSARFIVEVDGETHCDPEVDARRDAALASRGYAIIHVTNADVMGNVEGVLQALLAAIPARPAERPHPNPSPEGEGLLPVETNNA
ncbi:endonuclease domain-containing protein [Sphingomonas sp. ASY06-1R]|uniref:endonuclease domain-containing protein n=1 Tax=Sphingomonas sp. ASY06-1R TaxID=3445771 RepID=UPI003FA2E620